MLLTVYLIGVVVAFILTVITKIMIDDELTVRQLLHAIVVISLSWIASVILICIILEEINLLDKVIWKRRR